jgi:hypothetical protein
VINQDRKILFTVNKILAAFICWLFFLHFAHIEAKGLYPLSQASGLSGSGDLKGYTDIVFFRDKFIAVGTNGQIDSITKSGEVIPIDSSCRYNLRCAFSNEEILIAAGDHGTILYSTDGRSFSRAESGTKKNIHGVTFRNGLLIAGADSGTILTSKNGKSWDILSTEIKGNIVSLSANNSFFIAVSDIGEIIKSFDGIGWEIQDYNKEYAGYNKYSKFKKILATQNSIIIIGTHDDGSPSILFSSLGKVWTEREPIYQDDQGMIQCLTRKPNGITYDFERDQFILACDHGELLILPPCSKCNKYTKISETDLNALIYSDNCLLIVGNDYSVFRQRLR